jgi:eukaryotic-like serine/threonine-protein kinase
MVMLVVAIGMSFVAVTIREARRQKRVAKALEDALVLTESEVTWLGKMLGDYSLVNVTEAYVIPGVHVTDDMLLQIGSLSHLRVLFLDNTSVTDASLSHLKGLSQLEGLGLSSPGITDDGLKYLQELRHLKELRFVCPKVTDAGLMHLRGLRQLRTLSFEDVKVNGDTMKTLQEALPNCKIERKL